MVGGQGGRSVKKYKEGEKEAAEKEGQRMNKGGRTSEPAILELAPTSPPTARHGTQIPGAGEGRERGCNF